MLFQGSKRKIGPLPLGERLLGLKIGRRMEEENRRIKGGGERGQAVLAKKGSMRKEEKVLLHLRI